MVCNFRSLSYLRSPKKTRKRFNNVENAGSSSSKQSLSIDDTQQSKSRGPSRSRSSLCKSFDEHLVTHFEDRLDNKASRSVLLARSQSPECTIASSSSTASVPVSLKHHTSKNSHVVSSQKSVHDHSKDKLVVTCCGNTMTVKSKFNKRLVDLIGNVDLLSNLAKLGIFLDQHLDDLLHLKHHDLMEFLSDVASNQMTPLAKLQLIKTLQVESSDTRKRKSQALHLPFIPCPPLDRRLSDPNQVDNGLFHDLLQKATKLEDDEFQELIVRSRLCYGTLLTLIIQYPERDRNKVSRLYLHLPSQRRSTVPSCHCGMCASHLVFSPENHPHCLDL